MKVNKKKVIENIAASMIMVLAVVLVVVFLYDWGIDDIAIPIKDIYAPGDGRLTIAIFKMILSGGLNVISPPTTSLLNFPFQFQLYDFPLPFASNFMYIKFLSVFTDDAVVAFNLYYLSTFIMNALGMFFVLRVLRINIYIAVACSLIFTFLPFHFWRLPHTFYSGYFFIPFWIYVSISLFRRKALFFLRDDRGDVRVDYSFRNLFIVMMLLVSSLWNFYYTFFFAFLIIAVLCILTVEKYSKYSISSAIIVLFFVVVPFLINMAPYKIYEIEHGKNYMVGQRSPISAETLGLTVTSLVFPVVDHRIDKMSRLSQSYSYQSLLYNESNDAILGVFGSVGFVFLIVIMFFRDTFKGVLFRLSQMNMAILLLSTVGGFGVVFAYIVTPQIRAYNRVSIFISAIALITVAMLLSYYLKKSRHRIVAPAAGVLLAFFGVFDVVGEKMSLKPVQNFTEDYISDKKFISMIEGRFKNNGDIKIAQYPYLNFPESPGLHKMGNYEHLLGYIHSDQIRWSFGSIRGRGGDLWWEEVKSKKISEQVDLLRSAGFSGVLINRNGYADNGNSIESAISSYLGIDPIVSENGNLSFYKMTSTNNTIKMPLVFSGFYQWEGGAGKFRWGGKRPSIDLYNNDQANIKKNIYFDIGVLDEQEVSILLNNVLLKKINMVPGVFANFSYELDLLSGKNTLKFTSNASVVIPGGGDNRELLLSISNFRYD